jgi:hypothetical protein
MFDTISESNTITTTFFINPTLLSDDILSDDTFWRSQWALSTLNHLDSRHILSVTNIAPLERPIDTWPYDLPRQPKPDDEEWYDTFNDDPYSYDDK